MRFLPVNLHSFLVELASAEQTLALYDSLSATPLAGIEAMVPAARTLLIRTDGLQPLAQLAREIARHQLINRTAGDYQQITIPLHYNGEDLPFVAELYGLSVQQFIARHQQTSWKVAFIGFAPGFAYLTSMTSQWNTPRRHTPRTQIPAGSVALAGEFSGVYPGVSPGGWQLIGKTEMKMWDSRREPPALLLPGSEVRFVDQQHASRLISLPVTPATGRNVKPSANPLLKILNPGLQTSWQDAGRSGGEVMGISPSGAMDKGAFRHANHIAGNPPDTPCLEITGGGFRALAQQDLVMVLTGAPCPVTLRISGKSYNVTFFTPFSLAAGDEIMIGAPACGIRSYLAIRGGCETERFLNSASFDSLAKAGPAPLQPGDLLYPARGIKPLAVQLSSAAIARLPASGETVILDIIAGPRTDWFTSQAIHLLTCQKWHVTMQSNRIGLRLQGEQGLERSQHQELPSEGVCSGAIQVPASGQPVLFLNDHPLTGGYPVIAALADYHLDLAGQIPPGGGICFNLIHPFNEICSL